VHAVERAADALPLLIPVLPQPLDPLELLAGLDGLLLPGSPSNIDPRHYEQGPPDLESLLDPERDATTLPLIRAAIEQGVPIFAICRGFQELNVALGGTLWRKVHEAPGHADHRENPEHPLEQQYAPAHELRLEGPWLRALAGGASEPIRVNSLHGQGVRELAPGLRVEARAPDGLIEAASLPAAPALTFGVQWHPEWQVMTHDLSPALFAAFGAAARERARKRARRGP
jgi:putative glutamine amidotransferase